MLKSLPIAGETAENNNSKFEKIDGLSQSNTCLKMLTCLCYSRFKINVKIMYAVGM